VLGADGYLLIPRPTSIHVGRAQHVLRCNTNPFLEATPRRPYGLYVHGNKTPRRGAGMDSITTGLRWPAPGRRLFVVDFWPR